MTLKELTDVILKADCVAHPNIPTYAVPRKKLTDKTSNGLQNAILAYFKYRNIKAWRQRSEGRYLPGQQVTNVIGQTITTRKGKFIPLGKSGGIGLGDVVAVLPPYGRSLHIEVKVGKDRQRETQKQFQIELESSGGI
jgi:hypothetical protein